MAKRQENLTTDGAQLLTLEQAAQRLGMSESFMRKVLARKEIDHIKLGGGRSSRIRFTEKNLEDYINANRVESEAALR